MAQQFLEIPSWTRRTIRLFIAFLLISALILQFAVDYLDLRDADPLLKFIGISRERENITSSPSVAPTLSPLQIPTLSPTQLEQKPTWILPGPCANKRIFLFSAILNVEPDSGNTSSVDFIALNPEYFTKSKDQRVEIKDLEKFGSLAETLEDPRKWTDRDLYCKLNFERTDLNSTFSKVQFIETTNNIDGNVNHGQLIFRCFFENRLVELAESGSSIQIGLQEMHSKDNITVEFGIVQVSLQTRVNGIMKPLQHGLSWSALRYRNQFLNDSNEVQFANSASLCSCCIWEFLPAQMLEFIEFHLQVGFKPIFIGVYATDGLIQKYELLLSDYIERGLVSVTQSYIEGLLFTNKMQVFFNNQCFYYTKSISKWTGFWDLDEFFYYTGERIDQNENAFFKVQNVVKNLTESYPNHDDICYISIDSVHMYSDQSTNPLGRDYFNIDRFPFRSINQNDVWTKTLVNTRLTYSVGIHTHFSCSAQNMSLKESIFPESNFVIGRKFSLMKNVMMFHFINLFYPRIDGSSDKSVESEYSKFHNKTMHALIASAARKSKLTDLRIPFVNGF
jgi:hypothetical protein